MSYYRSYEEEDEYKVYIYYIDNRLYAWTIRKEDRDFFESQRNMKVFIRKKKRMEPIVFRGFMVKYKDHQILEIPLESDGCTYLIRGTYAEDTELSLKSDEILKTLDYLDLYFQKIIKRDILPDKYEKSIRTLLSFQTIAKNKDREFRINSLSLFYNLFKFTF